MYFSFLLKLITPNRGLCYVIGEVYGRPIYWCTPALNEYEEKNHPFPELLLFIYKVYPNLNWKERKIILEFCAEITK